MADEKITVRSSSFERALDERGHPDPANDPFLLIPRKTIDVGGKAVCGLSDVAEVLHDQSCLQDDIHEAGIELFDLRREFVETMVENFPRASGLAQGFLGRAIEIARRQGHYEGEYVGRSAVEAAYATLHQRFAFAEAFEIKKAADRANEDRPPQRSDGEPTSSIVARRISWLRKHCEVEFDDAAERFGMTEERLRSIEGCNASIDLDEALAICTECGCEPDFLLGRSDVLGAA